jgi:hypothetical protein
MSIKKVKQTKRFMNPYEPFYWYQRGLTRPPSKWLDTYVKLSKTERKRVVHELKLTLVCEPDLNQTGIALYVKPKRSKHPGE